MAKRYSVNNNRTNNPGYHHEVHTEEHANAIGITNKSFLGNFDNCHDTLLEAKKTYRDADGCAICCNPCHTG